MEADDFFSQKQPNSYFDPQFQLQAVKILPGEYYVTQRELVIVTVLGSCVSACIRDPETRIGGMNHFMLPEYMGEGDSPLSASARYGAYAMEVLINKLQGLGARRERLQAKLFGGGRVLAGMTDVGSRNTKFVVDYLRRERIPVLAEDMGDVCPRKVYFFPHSGRVLVKQLREVHNDTVYNREKNYAHFLDKQAKSGGEVDLF